MYTQFTATEREEFAKALKVLNSDGVVADNKAYFMALSSALNILNNSHPLAENRLEWAAEIIPAYREIGKNLSWRLEGFRTQESEELLELERRFGGILGQYERETIYDNLTVLLSALGKIGQDSALAGYKESTLTGRIRSALEDFESVSGVMNLYEIKDAKSLEAALKERRELKEQAEMFDREIF